MKPIPLATPETAPYWQAAVAGRFVLQRCGACGRYHHPPRRWCPHCWSRDLAWAAARGRGRVVTYTIVHQAPSPGFAVPYVLAIVELEEGPRMMCNLVDGPVDEVAIDLAVEVTFERRGEFALPQFRKVRT